MPFRCSKPFIVICICPKEHRWQITWKDKLNYKCYLGQIFVKFSVHSLSHRSKAGFNQVFLYVMPLGSNDIELLQVNTQTLTTPPTHTVFVIREIYVKKLFCVFKLLFMMVKFVVICTPWLFCVITDKTNAIMCPVN